MNKSVPCFLIDSKNGIVRLGISSKNTSFILIIDEIDLEKIREINWHIHWGKTKKIESVVGRRKNQSLQIIHRFILHLDNPKQVVDHINGNPLDNRRVNMRICIQGENVRNRSAGKNNTSGYKGVSYSNSNKSWIAYVTFNRKLIYLGSFKDKNEAALAHNNAVLKYHGVFGKLNEIWEPNEKK